MQRHPTTIPIILATLGIVMSGLFVGAERGIFMKQPHYVLSNTRLPLRSYVLTINNNDQPHVIEELRAFSTANHFSFRVAQVTPDPRDVSIKMNRSDLEIFATNAVTPTNFQLFLYVSNNTDPPVPAATLDAVEQSLRSFVPGITRKK